MWWVKTKETNNDYGPDFGVDYARFSDPPDILKDLKIRELLSHKLEKFEKHLSEFQIKVRNGFVLLQGNVTSKDIKMALIETIYATEGVKEVINNLHVRDE